MSDEFNQIGAGGNASYYPNPIDDGTTGSSAANQPPPEETKEDPGFFEAIAALWDKYGIKGVKTNNVGASGLLACTPHVIGAPSNSGREGYPSKVEFNFPQPVGKEYFYGNLTLLPDKYQHAYHQKEFMRSIELLSNGRFDMLLKSSDNKIYHLVAPKNDQTIKFALWHHHTANVVEKSVSVQIGGEVYEVLGQDSANSDIATAQEQLENEIYSEVAEQHREECEVTIKRVATPNNPLPQRPLTEASVLEYCKAQYQDAYGLKPRSDLYYRIMLGYFSLEEALNYCQDLPETDTRNLCHDKFLIEQYVEKD